MNSLLWEPVFSGKITVPWLQFTVIEIVRIFRIFMTFELRVTQGNLFLENIKPLQD